MQYLQVGVEAHRIDVPCAEPAARASSRGGQAENGAGVLQAQDSPDPERVHKVEAAQRMAPNRLRQGQIKDLGPGKQA